MSVHNFICRRRSNSTFISTTLEGIWFNAGKAINTKRKGNLDRSTLLSMAFAEQALFLATTLMDGLGPVYGRPTPTGSGEDTGEVVVYPIAKP
jgi:hypothetical protein